MRCFFCGLPFQGQKALLHPRTYMTVSKHLFRPGYYVLPLPQCCTCYETNPIE